eukprot:g989.t1
MMSFVATRRTFVVFRKENPIAIAIRKQHFGSRFFKWMEDTTDEGLIVRVPLLNITVRTSEEVVRSHLKFGGVVLVYCAAFAIAHHDAKRMMKANALPAPVDVYPGTLGFSEK